MNTITKVLITLLLITSFVFHLMPGASAFYLDKHGDLLEVRYITIFGSGCFYQVYKNGQVIEAMVIPHGSSFFETATVPHLYCNDGWLEVYSYEKEPAPLVFLPMIMK